MIMKHIRKSTPFYILGLLLLFSSCNKWLDVKPRTQMTEEEQFSTRQGYTDALFGIYQNSAGLGGYGKHLTFSLLDILAQRYENKSITTSVYYKIARYNYTDPDVRNVIDSVFNNSYQSIAQANYLLKNVDKNNGILDATSYKIIKGEALGMRGFLHFDLVRLFAQRYADGANAGMQSIPYLRSFTVSPQARLSLGAVLDSCEADLKAAEVLLEGDKNIDRIAGNQGSTNPDLLLQYRQNHLNYWAVKATLARLYLYKGDKVNALKYAQDVIKSGKFTFINPSLINTDATSTGSDMTFTNEHVFSIYTSGLKKQVDVYFKNVGATGEVFDLYTTRAKLDAMYQCAVGGYGAEIRRPAATRDLWNVVSPTIVYSKKYWSDNSLNVKQRVIPVIRLSEMYYIAAESAPTIAEGLVFLNMVRTNRLLPELTSVSSQAAFDLELQFEYRKEFYAEGQLWFYYKRKNVLNIPDGVANPMTEAKYTFPLPNAEIEFGTSGVN